MNFALIGAAGYIAPRHMQAIHDTGHVLAAALDPHDAVGILDRYFPEAHFFTEYERFDRYLEKLRRKSETDRIHYVSICSPNYLHDAHIRSALRVSAHAICEKPLVINPWNLDALASLEEEAQTRVYTVLQLRLNPSLIALKNQFENQPREDKLDVVLTYITRRGRWYPISWKGDLYKSGGVAMNIGIHFFDLLIWFFGSPELIEVHLSKPDKISGFIELERARVRWFLSVDVSDLPPEAIQTGKYAYRSMMIDGISNELSEGFTDLHTRVYEDILNGGGFGIEDARPSIDLVYKVRQSNVIEPKTENLHPFLRR